MFVFHFTAVAELPDSLEISRPVTVGYFLSLDYLGTIALQVPPGNLGQPELGSSPTIGSHLFLGLGCVNALLQPQSLLLFFPLQNEGGAGDGN